MFGQPPIGVSVSAIGFLGMIWNLHRMTKGMEERKKLKQREIEIQMRILHLRQEFPWLLSD